MKKIKLTNEEIDYLRGALNYYCDIATHHNNDTVGLDPKSRESKVLDRIREKLIGGK